MRPVLVQSAMPLEVELLVSSLEGAMSDGSSVCPVTRGFIGDTLVLCSSGGVGKANAAATAATLIERHSPAMIIITGCGGAYPGSGLATGELAVASDEIFGDEGVIDPDGWHDLTFMSLPVHTRDGVSCYNSIPLSRHAAERAVQLADSLGVRLVRGRFVTVSTCSGTGDRGLELVRQHQAVCENMEGAAIALAALRYGIPCLEIRGISNLVEDRDMSRWNIPVAVENAQRFVLKVIEGLNRADAASHKGKAIPEV